MNTNSNNWLEWLKETRYSEIDSQNMQNTNNWLDSTRNIVLNNSKDSSELEESIGKAQLVEVYDYDTNELLKTYDPKNIGVFGSSTGGGMTLALVLMLKDQGLPLPGAIAAQTPWSDMAEIGDTYFTNRYTDNVLVTYDGWLDDAARVYANGHDLKDPYLSPVYGDYSNFPPTLLISGTRDLFLSNTVRVQEKLLKEDVEVSLIVYEGQSHVQYYSAPNVPEHHFHFENLTKFFEKYL